MLTENLLAMGRWGAHAVLLLSDKEYGLSDGEGTGEGVGMMRLAMSLAYHGI